MKILIVPTLRVVMHPLTLRVIDGTQSVQGDATTQSVGAIINCTIFGRLDASDTPRA